MPFSRAYESGAFSPEDLQILRSAYLECCKLMNIDPKKHPNAAMLARYIVRHFEAGITSPSEIAQVLTAALGVEPNKEKPWLQP